MHTSGFYKIRVEGHIGDSWSSWFEGMAIDHEESGETVLSGTLEDEAALERYCRAFRPEVESVSVMPVDATRAVAKSTGNQTLGFFAGLMPYFDRAGEMGDPAEANRLLGAPATTLEAWIERRRVEQR